MNPRLSMPTTAWMPAARNGLHISSTACRSASTLPSSGVMSLNIMPFFGKSGTSRMNFTRSAIAVPFCAKEDRPVPPKGQSNMD